jgi:hypothetical protein
MPLARLALAVLAVAAWSPAAAGVVIEGTDASEDSKTVRFVMDGQKLRMDTNGGAQAMIFDGATKRSVQLDAASKSYTEFTKDDIAKMKAMMAQAGVQQGAGAAKKRTIRYEKTGKTDRALGKSCDVYRVVDPDGTSDEEMCVAPYGSFGVDRADLAGLPLLAWDEEDGQRRETFRATKIEKRSVPGSEFSVPAGWKKNPGFAEQMEQMQQQLKQQQGATGK